MIDLNVALDMESVVNGERTLEETGLDNTILILNKITGINLVPGFSLAELPPARLSKVKSGIEKFIEKYCPKYVDAPNAIHTTLENTEQRSCYAQLPTGAKIGLSPHYLGMLRARIIDMDNSARPYIKFERYIGYMTDVADVLSPLSAHVAAYIFYPPAGLDNKDAEIFSGKIRSNFRKSARTSEKLLKVSMNSSWDLFYYWISAMGTSHEISGRKQDLWILTSDSGLATLADSFYFIQKHRFGPATATLGAEYLLGENEYFSDCAALLSQKSLARKADGKDNRDGEDIFNLLNKRILESEDEIRQLLPSM